MHHKNNNNDAARKAAALRDPHISSIARNDGRDPIRHSETMKAVMDEMSGTATSRRALLYNRLRH